MTGSGSARRRFVLLFAGVWLAPVLGHAQDGEPTGAAGETPTPAAEAPATPEPMAPATPPPSSSPAVAPATAALSEPAAQPRHEVRHGIGLRLGPRATTVREDLLVPLTFSGGGPDLGATYRGLLGPGLLDARSEIALALVANRFGHLGLTLHHALAVAYRLPLPGSLAWRFALGGAVGESSDSLALESWDDAHGYWVGLGWLGPSASLQGPLSAGWQLAGTAELALVGTVGRPPRFRDNKQDANGQISYYTSHPFANSSFFAPWNVQFFRFDIAARWTPSEDRVGRGWSFGCQGRFVRASEPATILVFETVLYAAWTWGL
jgi:hypothetical protein